MDRVAEPDRRREPDPVEPEAGNVDGVAPPEFAVEELELQGASVADRAQVGDHPGEVGDAVAGLDPVRVGLHERGGRGGQVVDVEAGEAIK